ncbi:MAG TPA: hypothetical protein VM889_07695 [Candidatus Thermoplasmatota archaeon]|nr:hypothetical protein [Candidatus Thermoplasmatota archaeon]
MTARFCAHCRANLRVTGPGLLFEEPADAATSPLGFVSEFCSPHCYHAYGLSRYAVVEG